MGLELELELEKLVVGSMDPWTVCHKFCTKIFSMVYLMDIIYFLHNLR
jgi:hypothetical protein